MRYQPQGRLRIAQAPIAASLIFAFNGNGYDAVSGKKAANLNLAATPSGIGHVVTGSSTVATIAGLNSPATSVLTIFSVLLNVQAGGGYQGIVGKWDGLNSGRFGMGLENGSLAFTRYDNGSSDAIFAAVPSAPRVTLAVVQDVVAAYGYINGVSAGTNGQAKTFVANSDTWYIGTYRGGQTNENLPATNVLTLVFNRALSAREIKSLHDNPWQVFDAGSSSSAYQSAVAVQSGAPTSNGNAAIAGVSSASSAGVMGTSAGASTSAAGVSASSRAGTISSSGSAAFSVSGASATAFSGIVVGNAAASASVLGVASVSQAGVIAAVASGVAQVSGTSASASTGTVSANASGNVFASVLGVAASAQAGIIAYATTGIASISGVSASALSGIVSANASGNSFANLLGIVALSSAGIVSSSASASASTSGSAVAASTGLVSATANGNATAAVLGVAASSGTGAISTSGSARASVGTPIDQGGAATTSGVSAFAMVGVLLGSVSARANISGVSAMAATGTMTATGVIDGNVSAYLTGLVAATTVGMIAATGTRTKITVDITEDMLCKVVRDYIMSIAKGMRVVRTPVNKASMPDGAYVAFTPGTRSPLSTNVGNYMSDSRSVMRAEQMRFQIDCYGEGARDLAEILNTLFRDQYACDQFSASGLNIAPLYAGDIMQMPFVNDADQYEERYTFEIFLQVNSIIITAQQSCNMLGINILSVDANFPPV